MRGFRYAILAKLAAGGDLCSGLTLRCPRDTGEVQRSDDRCSICGHPSEVVRPDFWLWLPGDRDRVASRRCDQDGFLYLRHEQPCPRQTEEGPSHSWCGPPVNVWIRTQQIAGWDFSRVPGREPMPADAAVNLEQQQRILDTLAGMQEGPERDLARTLLVDHHPVGDVARDIDHKLLDLEFLRLLAAGLAPFHDLLPADFENRYQKDPQRSIARLVRAGHALEVIVGELGQPPRARAFRERLLLVLWDAVNVLCERKEDDEEGEDDDYNADEGVDE